jgi:glucokinase
MMARNDQVAIALDLGGTTIKSALIARDGTLLALERSPSPSQSAPDDVARLMISAVERLLAKSDRSVESLAGIGVSIAAFITASGIVTATAHLSPGWVGFDLRSRLAQVLPANYYFCLDAPAPTLGEAYYGAGRGCEDFAFVTVSTGIGAGVFAGGKLYTGGTGWAGGVGHVIVEPNGPRVCDGCGNAGCLETYSAKQGVLALAAEAIERHPESLLAQATETLTPQSVCAAACEGDEAARWVFSRAGYYLGLGLTNLIDILSPQRVVVGGGVALAGELLLEPARQVVRRMAFPPVHRQVPIVPAALGDLSGVYGVAAMAFHDIRVNFEDGASRTDEA